MLRFFSKIWALWRHREKWLLIYFSHPRTAGARLSSWLTRCQLIPRSWVKSSTRGSPGTNGAETEELALRERWWSSSEEACCSRHWIEAKAIPGAVVSSRCALRLGGTEGLEMGQRSDQEDIRAPATASRSSHVPVWLSAEMAVWDRGLRGIVPSP